MVPLLLGIAFAGFAAALFALLWAPVTASTVTLLVYCLVNVGVGLMLLLVQARQPDGMKE